MDIPAASMITSDCSGTAASARTCTTERSAFSVVSTLSRAASRMPAAFGSFLSTSSCAEPNASVWVWRVVSWLAALLKIALALILA